MKQVYLCIVIFIALTQFGSSQVWNQKASICDYGRFGAIGCSCGGKGYIGLGEIEDGTFLNDFWEYDTLTNHWTRKADFPGGGRFAAVAYPVNGMIYVFFGFDNSNNCNNDVWAYNPSTNTWIQKSVFPGQPRFCARGFVISDSLVFIGTGTYNSSYDYLYDFWMYNPSDNSWTSKSDFPGNRRMGAVSFEINGTGYLGCGLSDPYTPHNDFWKYNPQTDSWSAIPDLPATSVCNQVSFVLKNEGYVGTGFDVSQFYNTFYRYNPQNNSWLQIVSAPTDGREVGIGFTIGNKGYFGAGWDIANIYTDFWSFDPDLPVDIGGKCTNEIVKLYPNPATSKTSIILQKPFDFQGRTHVSICNIQGQKVIQQVLQNDSELDITGLVKGIYIVNVYDDKTSAIKTLIKE
jgi:N-acetylneuraminic acid mutarotase